MQVHFAQDADVDNAHGQSIAASLWALLKDDPYFIDLGIARDQVQTLGQLPAFREHSDLLGSVEDVQCGYELHSRSITRMNRLAVSLATAAKQFSAQAAAIKKARTLEAKERGFSLSLDNLEVPSTATTSLITT